MTILFNEIIEQLKSAREAATMERFGTHFPHERIQIGATHFPDTGFETGTEMHPDEFIKAKVRLHHDTWVIAPIDRVIEMLQAHAELVERVAELKAAIGAQNLERIARLARAGLKG